MLTQVVYLCSFYLLRKHTHTHKEPFSLSLYLRPPSLYITFHYLPLCPFHSLSELFGLRSWTYCTSGLYMGLSWIIRIPYVWTIVRHPFSLYLFHICKIITNLDIIHRPVFYLKLNSIGSPMPHTKHITSTLRVQQANAAYRFVTMVYKYNYHNSGHYLSSCLSFYTQFYMFAHASQETHYVYATSPTS
jgi:hypothetical protein